MKKGLILLGLASASLLSATVVNPDTAWVTLPTPATTTGEKITTDGGGAGTAYWNNDTEDYSTCANIGCYITSTGEFAPGKGAGLSNPVYLASDATGTAATSFYIDPAGANNNGTTLEYEIAGLNSRNWLGWYDVTAINSAADFTAANYAAGKWGVMYTGGQGQGAGAFTPSSAFGLWLLPDFQTAPPDTIDPTAIGAGIAANGVFSETDMNVGDVKTWDGGKAAQHFALFASQANPTIPADFWIGIEDRDFIPTGLETPADRDYNDMIIHMRITPEPGYYALLSLGLAGLGLARRRLNKASK